MPKDTFGNFDCKSNKLFNLIFYFCVNNFCTCAEGKGLDCAKFLISRFHTAEQEIPSSWIMLVSFRLPYLDVCQLNDEQVSSEHLHLK